MGKTKISNLIIAFVSIITINSCNSLKNNVSEKTSTRELVIGYSNPNIKYSGRIDSSSLKGVDVYWSGTSINLNFEGESIQALFENEGDRNYYNIILDNDSIMLFHPTGKKKYYNLVSNLSEGNHTLQIFRRTEWSRGKTTFYGFKIQGNAKILPKSDTKKRKIEFYGDSITAGYGNEDPGGGNNPDSTFTNNYMSYSAITARNLNAEYSCIAKGGIGIMISFFDFTMPDIYDRLNPNDNTSKWDFSLYTPEVVVVNLFQNDSWLVKKTQRKGFKNKFGTVPPTEEYIINAYKDFIQSIRNKYPDANIICTLGSMDATKEGSPWPGYIKKAVHKLKDPKIKSYIFKYKNTGGHPSVEEDKVMAAGLTKFINENIEW